MVRKFQRRMTDAKANEIVAEFIREKIQARIKDPDVAYSVTPTDHPFGSKRVPLERIIMKVIIEIT